MQQEAKNEASLMFELQERAESSDQGRNIGSWTFQENLLYIIFLDLNKLIMASKKKRKKNRIFDLMAQFVQSRNSLQCRSHHQKLMEKLGQVKIIITNFKKIVGKDYYRQQYLKLNGRKDKKRLCEDTRNQIKQVEEEEESMVRNTQVKQQVEQNIDYRVDAPPNQQFITYSPYFFGNQYYTCPFYGNYYTTVPSLI